MLNFLSFVASKPPIIVTHGLFGMGSDLRGVCDEIARALPAFPVFLADQRNHGNSPRHPHISYPGLLFTDQ